MRRIFIDFDGTITPTHGFQHEPDEETVRVINELYYSGDYEIIIYSCRANPQICDPSDVKKMTDYLDRNGIYYHGVEPNKPLFDIIIDDRSINPVLSSWNKVYEMIIDEQV